MAFYEFLYKFRFVFGSVFVVVVLFLVSLIVSSMDISKLHAQEAAQKSAKKPPVSQLAHSPNVVTQGMVKASHQAGQTVDSFAYTALNGAHAAATSVAQSGTLVARGVQTGVVFAATGVAKGTVAVGQGIGKGAVAVANTVGSGVGFVLRVPGNIAGFASSSGTSVVQGVFQPAHEHTDVPIIDPDSPELHAALAALPPKATRPAKAPAAPANNTDPIWPLNGRVTAEFGVPHWPFQPTHTGIDISSGKPAGVKPVKSFRPGRVAETTHASYGLGNHVIVDHGNGVTSVYAHLDSISVKTGQKVDTSTILGMEGTTGLSTGPHLHLEIRVNGQATDPRQFIGGNP